MFRLMIADDNPYVLQELQEIVDWEEFDLTLIGAYRNGKELLNAAKIDPPDVVITDINMPLLDGVALATALRDLSAQIRVVFLSNHSDFEYLQQALHLHIFDYLLKPIDPARLATVVKNVVQELCNERLQRFEHAQFLQQAETYRLRAMEHYVTKLIAENEEESLIRFKLDELGYPLPESFLMRIAHVVLSASIDVDYQKFINTVRSILQPRQHPRCDLLLLSQSTDAFSLLILYQDPHFDVSNLLSQLHIDLQISTGIDSTIGFSSAVNHFSMLGQLYGQAVIAATQQNAPVPVISYRDIPLESAKPMKKHSPATISSYVLKMQEHIHNNYQLPITTSDVASAVFLSSSYANQCFSAEAGCTIFDYITQCRIDHAKQLLAGTDTKVTSIAELVGYNSKTSFYLAFRRNVGVSPTEYRAMYGEADEE